MKRNIFDPRAIVNAFEKALSQGGDDGLKITVSHWAKYKLANGEEYSRDFGNVVTATGRNSLASHFVSSNQTIYEWMASGSGSAVGSLNSAALTYEVIRKSATLSSSNEVIISVCCFGGAADSITSSYLDEAGLVDNASSGQGNLFNLLTGIDHTFADSDVVEVHQEISVGSY